MKLDNETQERLQELQIAEQNFQNFLLQKQTFELELNEIEAGKEELKNSDDDVYRIAGQIMIKSNKIELLKELEDKSHILNLRIKSLENQEKTLKSSIDKLRNEIESKLKDKK